ncbi:hypothetical protein FB472_2131 [Rhodoglobus vestalii]|uniref:Uncharacterized protein n=1 Tax=Rhodoglobus vestalii TaxID=193384 RepID=A0A8H2PZ99_9MICO|nr:hypothetical protein FB472_2131 [Rhodoglobus vestalii]
MAFPRAGRRRFQTRIVNEEAKAFARNLFITYPILLVIFAL